MITQVTNPALHKTKIYVGKTLNKGRGIFANKDIFVNEIIEVCPLIILPETDSEAIVKTTLVNYCFGWMDSRALALGNGSLYNHSYTPNALYIRHYEEKTLEFRAIKIILKNEEITVNYNGDPDSKDVMWFDVTD